MDMRFRTPNKTSASKKYFSFLMLAFLAAANQNCVRGFKATYQGHKLAGATGSTNAISAVEVNTSPAVEVNASPAVDVNASPSASADAAAVKGESLVTVLSAGPSVCGQDVVNNPNVDASPVLQACIDASNDVQLAPGQYFISNSLQIHGRQNLRIQTSGVGGGAPCLSDGGPNCAVLVAANDFKNGPIIYSTQSSGLNLVYIALDGNTDGRRATLGNKWSREGFNAMIHDCTNCTFFGFASVHAVFGTGLEFIGDYATFYNVLFRDNGYGINLYKKMGWADGLTMLESRGVRILNSQFVNNSDINLILGGAPDGEVSGNYIASSWNFVFAGLMFDNFNHSRSGDFTGLRVHDNVIDCGEYMCGIGIDIGPRIWNPSANPIYGGTFFNNQVFRARQGIGIYGASDSTIYGNYLEDVGGFGKGRRKTSAIDMFGNETINLDGGGFEVTEGRLQGVSPKNFIKLRR